ncbi:MAG: PEGA domain-containing protein [Lachnospira sp.]|nr:PEGA domain-containing protein [Lachnospira sp.]
MNMIFSGPFSYKRIGFRLVALLLMASLLIVVPGCQEKKPDIVPGNEILPMPTKPITEAPTNSNNEIVIKGVFTHLDVNNMKMNFVDMTEYVEYEVSYHGGTDIKSKYDSVIIAGKMQVGEIYDVVCDSKGMAKTIYASKDAWEKKAITGFDIDDINKTIAYGSVKLSYNSNTVVLSEGRKITASAIVPQDEITIRGVGKTTYSITVDKGHGFLKLTGVDAFINGYVSVGNKQLLTVTKDMMVTVQEGTYTVELQNGKMRGEKNVTIKTGEESVLDFSEYIRPAVQNGVIKFMVNVDNAIMVLDGKEMSHESLHTLSYGTHTAVFKANGYKEYYMQFTVDSAYETLIVDMVKSDTTTSTTSSTDKTKGYVVKVTAPTGASLYVDSVYVGTVPCEFDKSQGNKIITLAQSGYETVSYTISIANATGDLTYAFPAMTKKD